jgi:hypothetical protein
VTFDTRRSLAASQHGGCAGLSADQLIYARREDILFEEGVYETVIRIRAQAANRHQRADMLKAKGEAC